MNRKNSVFGDGYEYNEVSNLSVDSLNTLGTRGWFCVTLARVPGGKGWSGLMGRLINVAEEVSTAGAPITVEELGKRIGKQLEGFVEHPTSVDELSLKEEARLRRWKEGDPKGLWYRSEGGHWVVGLGGWRRPGGAEDHFPASTKMEKDPDRRLNAALTAWAPADARACGWKRDEEGNWEDAGGIVRVVSDEEEDGKWWPGDGPEDRAVRIALLAELISEFFRSRSDPSPTAVLSDAPASGEEPPRDSDYVKRSRQPVDLDGVTTWGLFHRLWSKAVGSETYLKGEWVEMEKRLLAAGIGPTGVLSDVSEEPSASERETIRLKVFRMLASERGKQIEKYGDDHDDGHVHGELAITAAYLLRPISPGLAPEWAEDLRKKHAADRVRQLVIAAALSIREIERLFRAEKRQEKA